MPEFITLVGSEAIIAGGKLIATAAEDMKLMVSALSGVFEEEDRLRNIYLDRLEAILEKDRALRLPKEEGSSHGTS